jgi:hypothetical protein
MIEQTLRTGVYRQDFLQPHSGKKWFDLAWFKAGLMSITSCSPALHTTSFLACYRMLYPLDAQLQSPRATLSDLAHDGPTKCSLAWYLKRKNICWTRVALRWKCVAEQAYLDGISAFDRAYTIEEKTSTIHIFQLEVSRVHTWRARISW